MSEDTQHHHPNPVLSSLPMVVAGPILRNVTKNVVTLWMITSSQTPLKLNLKTENGTAVFEQTLDESEDIVVQVGNHAFVHMITIAPQTPLENGARYFYDIQFLHDSQQPLLSTLLNNLLYPQQTTPSFVFQSTVTNVLHGSCRKPHHDSDDGLLAVDQQLSEALSSGQSPPEMLLMTGDQVYVDDVAGPMLSAIHQVIEQLGLFHESLPLTELQSSAELATHPHGYYERPLLLPDDENNQTILSQFFSAKKKPIFTSVNANNHLISFAEVMAMYILTWSPEMWQLIDTNKAAVKQKYQAQYESERDTIRRFTQGLPKVRRALAHIPVYMIFDDHDITDDWNLTRGWEDAVYNHPFAKRIVGNALIGYWLCQGWGNNTQRLAPLSEQLCEHFGPQGITQHEHVVDTLLHWNKWHYSLDTHPKIVVLDTRTQRWRSETSLQKPSGLMDWEALCDLQQELINQPAVIMVSAAPVFGVKLIESIQRVFTLFGKALVVDAENWMAHKGTASVMLNIFKHHKTPPHFVILSGDVHYSFVYEVTLKFRRNSPQITQVTCSGIKNTFPDKLIRWLDRFNRVLFGPSSPLNWLTQRRYMTIKHRKPEEQRVRTLYNHSGIGKLTIDQHCHQVDASLLHSDGREIHFYHRD